MILEELSGQIIGAYYEVCRDIKSRHLEITYQRALVVALRARGLAVETEVPFTMFYRTEWIGECRLDILVENQVVVECKVADKLLTPHKDQLLSYLHATGMPLGLLFNFGPEPSFVRKANTRSRTDRLLVLRRKPDS